MTQELIRLVGGLSLDFLRRQAETADDREPAVQAPPGILTSTLNAVRTERLRNRRRHRWQLAGAGLAAACLASYLVVIRLLSQLYFITRADSMLGGMWAVIARSGQSSWSTKPAWWMASYSIFIASARALT